MAIHQYMWIQWSILQNDHILHTTYYIQNEWWHSLLLNSIQARQSSVQARQKMWCTPTKQGTSHTDLFWGIDNWSWHGLKNNSSFVVFFFTHHNVFSITSMKFMTDFRTFKHKKILHFLQPVISKTIGMGNFYRLISQNHTSRETPHDSWSYLKK